jgi:hypothetical protein
MGVSNCSEPIASLAAGAVLLLSLALGNCASSNSLLMDARAEAPAREYISLEDLPPTREKPAMTFDELAGVKKELIDLRERQAAAIKARDNNSWQLTMERGFGPTDGQKENPAR